MQKCSDIKNAIEAIIQQLDAAIGDLEDRLSNAIEGSLVKRNSSGYVRFFNRHEDGVCEYLGAKNRTELSALVQKRYETDLLKVYRTQRDALKKVLKDLACVEDSVDTGSLLQDLPVEIRGLVVGYDSNRVYIEKWLSNKAPCRMVKSPFHTMQGEDVRSKSEILIADRLFVAGVPYKYETPVFVDNSTPVYPDFKILNKRTLKPFYWEHFGRMDDTDYFQNTQWKLEEYASLGLFPGKNLIFTFECLQKPLNTRYVDSLIREYLL